jgi:tRNA pseudouridine55 synthase
MSRSALSGAIVVDKPQGPSSHDVVARVRRALGVQRIGHTGTLDPLATGVLPLLVGPATRLARFLTAGEKIYDARIRLGAATDTYDATGKPIPLPGGATPITPPADPAVIAAALSELRSTMMQTPPPFSAKRIGGHRAYDLARREKPVDPEPVAVTASALDLVHVDGSVIDVRVVCSPGYYVRSLAHDLGVRLGCGAHLEALRRVRSGGFGADEACPLDTIEREGHDAAARLVPPERLLPDLPAVVLTERGATRAAHGNPVMPSDYRGADQEPRAAGVSDELTEVRLLDSRGALLGIGAVGTGRVLHPVVVLV